MNKCGPMSSDALTRVRCSREVKNNIALETIDPFPHRPRYGKEMLGERKKPIECKFTSINKSNPVRKFGK